MNPSGGFSVGNSSNVPGNWPAANQQQKPTSSQHHHHSQQPLVMRTRISPSGVTIVSAPIAEPQLTASQIHDAYVSLLGMAEHFHQTSPPNIRLVIHCLKSILNFKLPANYEARTHLQLGKILFLHSKSEDLIKHHLEKARVLGAHLRAPDDIIKFEAADLLADFYERKVCYLLDRQTFFLFRVNGMKLHAF